MALRLISRLTIAALCAAAVLADTLAGVEGAESPTSILGSDPGIGWVMIGVGMSLVASGSAVLFVTRRR